MPQLTPLLSTAAEQQEEFAKNRPGSTRVGSMGSLLFTPRPAGGFGWPEALSLALYIGILFATIAHHESWFDEAQAWLIARDSSLADLFLHRLHYEGAPGLWHLLLWCEARCGITFAGMHYIAGGFAAGGMAVWLRFNPLPRLLSLLMPFTYFFMFQYAVVARSYTLAPLFVFVLLHLYSRKKSSPLLFAVIAGLFANCSLHMAAFAVGLALLYANDRLALLPIRGKLRWLAVPGVVFSAFLLVAAMTAVPTADGSSTTANPIVSSLRALGSHAPQATSIRTGPVGIALTPSNEAALQSPPQGRLERMFWNRIHLGPEATPKQRLHAALLNHVFMLLTTITAPISTSNLLALVLLGVVLWNVLRFRLWLALAPYVLVLLCAVLIVAEAHHIGLAWIALVAAVWIITLAAFRNPRPTGSLRSVQLLFILMLVVEVLQVGWSIHSVRADLAGPYSPGKALADFISQQPPTARIANFDQHGDVVNAYLSRRPYFNNDTSYYPFSRTRNPDVRLAETMATRPDMVVLTVSVVDTPVMNQWVNIKPKGMIDMDPEHMAAMTRYGYHETHRFCGTRFYRNAAEAIDCSLIFTPMRP